MGNKGLFASAQLETPDDFSLLVAAKFRLLEAMASDPKVTGRALKVGTMLVSRYFNTDYGYAWPSLARLATDLGCSPRTVQRGVDDLEAAGYVAVMRGRGRSGFNRYSFQWADYLGKEQRVPVNATGNGEDTTSEVKTGSPDQKGDSPDQKGDNPDRKTGSVCPHTPSINLLENPSIESMERGASLAPVCEDEGEEISSEDDSLPEPLPEPFNGGVNGNTVCPQGERGNYVRADLATLLGDNGWEILSDLPDDIREELEQRQRSGSLQTQSEALEIIRSGAA